MALKIITSRFKHLLKHPICLIITTYFFSSHSQIRVSDYLINHHQFSPEIALKVSSTVPYVKDLENPDAILLFLKEFGFSKSQIEKIVKCVPHVLCANLDNTVQPKVKIFKDLGFESNDIYEIISRDPLLLSRSATNRIAPSILLLKRIIGSQEGLCSILKKSSWGVLRSDLEKTVMPNIELMKSCGISSRNIGNFLLNYPRFFVYKPEIMKNYMERVDKMGFDRKSKWFLYAVRTLSSMTMEKWEHKFQLFQSLGFSEDDILSMFRRRPLVFAASEKKITEIIQVLLSTGEIDISSLIKYPVLFNLSIERRLKPRLKVLEILETKNLLKKKPTLTTVLHASEKTFLDKYVIPNANELMRFDEAAGGSANLPQMWLATIRKHVAVV